MITYAIAVPINGIRFLVRVCGLAILDRRVLLTREHSDSYWYLPGGRCRIDEPTRAALQREIQEEIGVRVTPGRLLWVMENFFAHGEDRFHEFGFYYLIDRPEELASDPAPLEESIEYAWFPLHGLPPIVPPFLTGALREALPGSTRHILYRDR